MTEGLSMRAGAASSRPADCDVRVARPGEAADVAAAVATLLRELGATPPELEQLEAAARALLADQRAGTVLVATAGDALVGVLAASWQLAIHVPGPYGLIQDLWVDPSWRGRAVGAALVASLLDAAAERGVGRVEVGVPRDGFPQLDATRRFYERCGFAPVGARLRWTGA